MKRRKKAYPMLKQKRLLIFMALFGVIGTALLVRSFAAGNSTITGTLFDDFNRNGIVEAGETPFTGKRLDLYRSDGTWANASTTDASGQFSFNGLEDGDYEITVGWVDANTLRPDWVPSQPSDRYFQLKKIVSLVGTKSVSFGLRKVTRSTTVGQPISAVTSPKGMRVESYNDAVSAEQILDALNEGSLRGGEEALTTVRLDLNSGSSCITSHSGTSPGSYGDFRANVYIDWLSWVAANDNVLFHEYGHSWALYNDLIVQQNGTFSGYLAARGLTGDSRLDSDKFWDPDEIIAEDYRQLFGSARAAANTQANRDIPDAKDVAGLKDYVLNTFIRGSGDTTPPTQPTNVTVSPVGSTEAVVSWSASTDNSGGIKNYDVYRNNQLISTVNAPSTTSYDIGLSAGSAYTYYVKARDMAGNLGAASAPVTITMPSQDMIPPAAPTNLVSTGVTKNSVGLQWQSTSEPGLTFRIYMKSSGKNSVSKVVGVVSANQFTVTGLSARTGYTFWVVAVDTSGNVSPTSNQLVVKTSR